jgi:hypothetical protein
LGSVCSLRAVMWIENGCIEKIVELFRPRSDGSLITRRPKTAFCFY